MRRLHWGLAIVVVIVLGAALPSARAGSKSAAVKIENRSDWTIEEIYLSPTDEQEWGPDQLGDEVIKPGGTFTLSKIPCDTWDVKLVDEDRDECIVTDVDLCGANDKWVITSKDLLKCQHHSQ